MTQSKMTIRFLLKLIFNIIVIIILPIAIIILAYKHLLGTTRKETQDKIQQKICSTPVKEKCDELNCKWDEDEQTCNVKDRCIASSQQACGEGCVWEANEPGPRGLMGACLIKNMEIS